jgi:hypothetical protein
VDRAVLVGAPDRDLPPRLAEEHLLELARLTDTAGGQVAGFLRQRISGPNPRFYIGDGKAEELAELVRDLPAVRIGATSEEQTLRIGHDGQSLASLSVEEMSRTYRDPLYRLLGMERG